MGFTELRNNLIDIIREEQAKLGFREEKIRLYYPLSSLNHLLEAHDDADAMNARLAAMPAEITDTLGDVVVTHKGRPLLLQYSGERQRVCTREYTG